MAVCSVGKWDFGKEEWRITYKSITSTFLDEIMHDIASQNWGETEWTTEFDTVAEAGIDTVVLIRAGYRERLAYPSVVVPEHVRTLPVHEDLVELFLRLCEPRNMRFFFGTYDSGRFWHRHEWSPNSVWPSARMLYGRYRDFVASRGMRVEQRQRRKPKVKTWTQGRPWVQVRGRDSRAFSTDYLAQSPIPLQRY